MLYQTLIVDDEEIVCRGLAQFVDWKEQGFEVAGTVCSVDAALTVMQQAHIDVVFMDIRMPGRTGLDLLKILQKEYPEVKSVILSGHSEFSYAQEAIRRGAVDYLTKPVSLSQITSLLARLYEEFEQQKHAIHIHANRMQALLLSAAKGYSQIDTEKYMLPFPKSWCGLSMSLTDRTLGEEDILQKKSMIQEKFLHLSPDAIVLDDEVFSLFVVVPCESESAFDSMIAILEQLCPEFSEWTCGVCEMKKGAAMLHEGWKEAGDALRYLLAGNKKGVIYYKKIESLFGHDSLTMQELLPDLLKQLSDPETRPGILPLMERALMQNRTQTVIQYQTSCIRFLIELNGYLQGLVSGKLDFHESLNKNLGNLLLCQDCQSTAECILEYLQWLVELLDQSDAQQLGKGAIYEIQLFIRQHYGENITLNSLAEQFFLHPNYLSRLFKEKTGTNFIEYLTQIRMEKVKELLGSSNRKIIDICAIVGYDNPRYFSKVFKQYTGMTPREYREHIAVCCKEGEALSQEE